MAEPVWKSKGFKSYFDYRNYLAQQQGYKSYSYQRKARELARNFGDRSALRGVDVNEYLADIGQRANRAVRALVRQQANTAISSSLGPASSRAVSALKDQRLQRAWTASAPNSHTLGRTTLFELDRELAEIANGQISRKKFEGKIPNYGRIVREQKPGYLAQIRQTFPDRPMVTGEAPSYVEKAYRAGMMSALGEKEGAAKYVQYAVGDAGELDAINTEARERGESMLRTLEKNASFRDRRLANATNWSDAKRALRTPLYARENLGQTGSRVYRVGLSQAEENLYKDVTDRAFSLGKLRGFQSTGYQYFTVTDGAECGWTTHSDPDKANGKVVTADEARQYPEAHRNCVRQFHPILDPKDGKKKYDEAKKKSEKARNQIGKGTKTAVAAVGAGVALLGLTAEVTLEGVFTGTVGDFLLSSVGVGLRRAMGKMIRVQERVIARMRRGLEARGYTQRLTAAAQALVSDQADLGNVVSLDAYRASLADEVHRAADEFDDLPFDATGANVSPLTRQVLGVTESAPRRVVGDNFDDYERYYRLNFKNELIEDVPGAGYIAQFLENQAQINQSVGDWVRGAAKGTILENAKYKGKYFRFTLPKINTIEGNVVNEAGDPQRVTKRYGRFSLKPNRLAHVHFSVLPNRDGSVRLISNLKINPNGMVRLGFVKGENGIITPNLSLVPKGPLRIYSRANRAGPTVKVQQEGWKYIRETAAEQTARGPGAWAKVFDQDTGAWTGGWEWKSAKREIFDRYGMPTGEFVEQPLTNLGMTAEEIKESGGTFVRKVWVKEQVELPNINKGLVNSVTTQVTLKTKWIPFNDHMWYKFRVKTKALGIKRPSDIRNLTIAQFRIWEQETDDKFTWLSLGTELRLRGGNLFDWSRTIRIDPTTNARIRNLEKNLDNLTSIIKDGIPTTQMRVVRIFDENGVMQSMKFEPLDPLADLGKKEVDGKGIPIRPSLNKDAKYLAGLPEGYTYDETVVNAVGETASGIMGRKPAEQSVYQYAVDQYLNLAEISMRTKVLWHAADVKGIHDEFAEMVKDLGKIDSAAQRELRMMVKYSPWEQAQMQWHLVKKNVESRAEQLTDYLITMQRAGGGGDAAAARARQAAAESKKQAKQFLDDAAARVASGDGLSAYEYSVLRKTIQTRDLDELERIMFERPQLIVSILEVDPKLLAKDLIKRLPDLEEIQTALRQEVVSQYVRYSAVLPDRVKARLEKRFSDDVLFSEGLISDRVEDSVGNLRYWRDTDEVFLEGSPVNNQFTLREGFRVGDRLDTSNYGNLRVFNRTPSSLTGLTDAPEELVEFVIDGPSVQKYVGEERLLYGRYEVVGYTQVTRNYLSPTEMPDDMPAGLQRLHRVYIRQVGEAAPELNDLAGSAMSEIELGNDLISHKARYDAYRSAAPRTVDMLNEYVNDPERHLAAWFEDRRKMSANPADVEVVKEVKRLIDEAPVSENNLMRVFSGEDAESMIEQLTTNRRYREVVGAWATDITNFPVVIEDETTLVLVLRNARAVNITPMLTDPPPFTEFLASGNFEVAGKMTDVSRGGRGITYIFLDYKRPI